MTTSNEDLKRTIRLTLASTHINAWERDFLRNMLSKLEVNVDRKPLTEKQYRKVMKITRPKREHLKAIDAQLASSQNKRSKQKSSFRNGMSHSWLSLTFLGLGALAILIFLVFQAVERFPEYFGPIVTVTAVEEIAGRATSVRDGDTIEVENVPVRFGSLDCAESNTTEGRRATTFMRALVKGESLTCHLNGRKSYDRFIGSCRLPDGRDLAGLMINEGFCKRYW